MLNQNDLSPEVRSSLYTQDYSSKPVIEGVQLITVRQFVSEEGDFSELARLDENGNLEALPDFKVRQINRSQIFPNSIKGWHIHYKQEDLWYVAPQEQLVVGLWDVRKDSPTEGIATKYNLGGGQSRMLLIPRGVAHGCVNYSSRPTQLYYFMNQQFNADSPDEQRLPWNSHGAEFWLPERD